MKTVTWLALLGSVLLMTSSCCSCRRGPSKNNKPLTETQWTLIQEDGKLIQANDNYYIIIGSEEGRFNGRGDCNSLMGSYTLPAEGKIDFQGIASTRAYCPDQAGEDRFFRMLDEVDSYEIDGNLLMLYTNGELTAIFEAKEDFPK